MATNRSFAEKGAQNPALIREVNERIKQLSEDAERPEFLCECADPACIETIELSIAQYESIRSSPIHFPIKPGHDRPDVERVIAEEETFAVVETFGEAAEIARASDPRSQPATTESASANDVQSGDLGPAPLARSGRLV